MGNFIFVLFGLISLKYVSSVSYHLGRGLNEGRGQGLELLLVTLSHNLPIFTTGPLWYQTGSSCCPSVQTL